MKFKEIENHPGKYLFECPGCEGWHAVWTNTPNDLTGAKWSFNGDINRPTISPSLFVHGASSGGHECHSFIKDGMIQFLGDCSHHLAGQTVEIPEWK